MTPVSDKETFGSKCKYPEMENISHDWKEHNTQDFNNLNLYTKHKGSLGQTLFEFKFLEFRKRR